MPRKHSQSQHSKCTMHAKIFPVSSALVVCTNSGVGFYLSAILTWSAQLARLR
uniref:Uncharacterized protein n=1 Tax=Anguilla anguilla TaxID=7936 RepID=A0A0E9XMU1_ANGAN